MRHLNEAVGELAAGTLPASLEEMGTVMRQVLAVAKKSRAVLAVMLAAARRHFRHDLSGWVLWAKENCELEGSDRDHLRAIGEMLLDLREIDVRHYVRLFAVDTDKLLSVSRIHRHMSDRLVDFLAAYRIEAMKREEVRDAVAECLGLEVTGKKSHTQPDLFDGLDILFDYDDNAFEELAGSERYNPAKGSAVAIGLLDATMRVAEEKGAPAEYLATLEAELRKRADRLAELRVGNVLTQLAG